MPSRFFDRKATMSNPSTRARLVLKTGSLVFGLSALLLLMAPGLFNELLGLATNPALEWSMRMIGITLVALPKNSPDARESWPTIAVG